MTPNPQVAQLTSLLNAHQAPEGVSSMEELHAWLEALPKHLCAWADSHKTDIFKVCSVLGVDERTRSIFLWGWRESVIRSLCNDVTE